MKQLSFIVMLISIMMLTDFAIATDRNVSRLTSALAGRSEQNRLLALKSLQSNMTLKLAAVDGLALAVEKNTKKIVAGREISPSTFQMIRTLSSIDRDRSYETVVALLDHQDYRIAMIAAESLGHYQRTKAIEVIEKQVERPEWETVYGFRFSVIRALVEMDDPKAFKVLRTLRQRTDGLLAHKMGEVLSKVPPIESKDGTLKLDRTAPSSLERLRMSRPRYYGIPINSKRVLFVMDRTCSMKSAINDGTKLGHAKDILKDAIEQLPEDYKFGVLTFDNKVHQWTDQLMLATSENKKDAIRYVQKQKVGDDRKNVHGALKRSLEFDDALEEVFLLTEGIPKVGPSPENIIDEIVFRNQLRHIKINVIGVGLNLQSRNFLQTLAAKCNGAFLEPAHAGNAPASWPRN